jgi:hypothetical protein
VAQNDLFKTILLFCPLTNKMPKSYYKQMKKTMPKNIRLTTQAFCRDCKTELVNNKCCSNSFCKRFMKKQASYDSFTFVNMDDQLSDIISLQYQNIKKSNTAKRRFVDIIDSEKYSSAHRTDQANTINLIVYTDGVQVTNSSTIEVWPIVCSIIELPPIIRNSVSNKLIFGLWCGKNKPDSDVLFEKFTNYILNLNTNGLDVIIEDKKIKFYIKLYGFLSDSPARSLSIKINQHNGYNNCPFCEVKGNFIYSNVLNIKLWIF